MSHLDTFLLVEFTDNNEIEVIPSNWLDGTKCAVWPSYKSTQKLTKAVRCREKPEEHWKSYPIRFLYTNVDYQKTRSKLSLAEDESDLQTDLEEREKDKRKKRPNPRFDSSSDEEYTAPLSKVNSARRKQNEERNQGPSQPEPSEEQPDLPMPPPRLRLNTTTSSSGTSVVDSTCLSQLSQTLTSPSSSRRSVGETSTIQEGTCISPLHRPLTSPSPSRYSVGETPTIQEDTCIPPLHRPLTSPSPFRNSVEETPTIRSRSESVLARLRVESVLRERDIRLFKILEEIKAEQKAQRVLLTNLAAQMGPDNKDCVCPEDIRLPMGSLEDISHVERMLQDQAVAGLLVDHLSTVGGGSLRIMTKRIMKRCMTSALGVEFNWTGAKGKKAFKSMKIATVILRAVRRNFPQQPHSETEVVVKDWLRNAKDRDGGRKKRTKSPNQENHEQMEESD